MHLAKGAKTRIVGAKSNLNVNIGMVVLSFWLQRVVVVVVVVIVYLLLVLIGKAQQT